MRKEVAKALQASALTPTFVLNGAFTDTNVSPQTWWQFDLEKGVFSYYGDGEQPCDFTTVGDAVRYTALLF